MIAAASGFAMARPNAMIVRIAMRCGNENAVAESPLPSR